MASTFNRRSVLRLLVGSLIACWLPVVWPPFPNALLPLLLIVHGVTVISLWIVRPRVFKQRIALDTATGDLSADVFSFMLTLLGLVGLFAIGFSLLSLVGFFVIGALKPAAIMLDSVMRPLPIKWQISLGCFTLWLLFWNALAIRRWRTNK